MENYQRMINEISEVLLEIDKQATDQFIQYINNAKHIFVAGAGRSGLMASAFANRLMHLGCAVSIVGEISSPHSNKDDVMIICSGSGETLRLINQAKIAKSNQVKIIVIIGKKNATLAKLADFAIIIPVDNVQSLQPMGTLFEQTVLLFLDNMILLLMDDKGETSQSMRARHADIE